jgi:hypothetical protein
MITHKQYLSATKLIKQYEEQLSKDHVSAYTCISCKKNMVTPYEGSLPHPLHQEAGMWKNGTVSLVAFGYGSMHDTESFYVAICDDCISEAFKTGLAKRYEDLEKLISK